MSPDGSATDQPSALRAKDAGSEAVVEQWRKATTSVRDTVKWIVAGFAAVGTILVGTAPLSGLGTVTEPIHWVLVSVGGAVAVGGVILAVWKASDVLFPEVTTLSAITEAAADSALGRYRDQYLGGPDGVLAPWNGDIATLRASRELEVATLNSIRSQNANSNASPETRAVLTTAEAAVLERIDQIDDITKVALVGADFTRVRDLARSRRWWLAACAVAVAVGTAAFLFGTGQADEDTNGTGDPELGRVGQVTLNASGQEKHGPTLGASCVTAPIDAIILNGDTEHGWTVVSTGKGSCTPAAFTISADQGAVTAAVAQRTTVALTEAGKETLGPSLGPECPLDAVPALVLDGDANGPWTVLSLDQEGCKPLQFALRSSDGAIEEP